MRHTQSSQSDAPGSLHLARSTWPAPPGPLHLARSTWPDLPGPTYPAQFNPAQSNQMPDLN